MTSPSQKGEVMARFARLVAVGMPHHVIQRGVRRMPVFFSSSDRDTYLDLLRRHSRELGLEVWAYCLMNNHVHLIVVPKTQGSLAKAIGDTHKRFTRMINFREGWRGYLWQGRFHSFILDEKYLMAAVRYVERNPVRAGLVSKAEDYLWSSARQHVEGVKGGLLTGSYLDEEITDWSSYLQGDDNEETIQLIRRHASTGRPLGSVEFIENLERKLGVEIVPKRPGPKGKGIIK
jgi:putative transposase